MCRYAFSGDAGHDAGGCYTGAWREDERQGKGRMRWPSGEEYIGDWECGVRHGNGEGGKAWGNDGISGGLPDHPEGERREGRERGAWPT